MLPPAARLSSSMYTDNCPHNMELVKSNYLADAKRTTAETGLSRWEGLQYVFDVEYGDPRRIGYYAERILLTVAATRLGRSAVTYPVCAQICSRGLPAVYNILLLMLCTHAIVAPLSTVGVVAVAQPVLVTIAISA